jgi:RNA polymerase sigma factor (sigma-70 family)
MPYCWKVAEMLTAATIGRQHAEDAFQCAMVEVSRIADRYDGRTSFIAFVKKPIRWSVLGFIKSERRAGGNNQPIDHLADSVGPSLIDHVVAHDVIAFVRQMVSLLPERQRMVVVWRFGMYGHKPHTHQEVADRLGITKDGADYIQDAAFRRLRQMMAEVA